VVVADAYPNFSICGIPYYVSGDLDLSYTPPLGSPWEAVQMGAQAWVRHTSQKREPGRS
jgi:hypothetical protein